ncbi:MAG: type II secretion system protein [Dehalococcoidia bacterium]|nr:type II secretion system protein [Dehalococcoidia bacterium]
MIRFGKGQRRFTLVELLIAGGIMAVLASIAVPVVVHLRGGTQTDPAAVELVELSAVQDAIDVLMAYTGVDDLPTTSPISGFAAALCDTEGEATDDMTAFPYSDGDWALFPASGDKYLRSATTMGTYYVDSDGTVHQASTGY